MSLNKSKSKRSEDIRDSSGHKRTWYYFDCVSCGTEIKVRSDSLLRSSGKCMSCAQKKKPFESIYNGLFQDHRKTEVILSYEQFLEFTKIDQCHYCGTYIPWVPYGVDHGKYKSRAYFLDRIDHFGPYSKENCVVCCTRCNKLRSNDFSYEEFLLIGKALREINRLRN